MANFTKLPPDQAKSWIGNMFQRVGSSFRERKCQSETYSSPSSPPRMTNRGSAPELSIFGVNLNKLKETCSRAFGGKDFYENPKTNVGITTDGKEDNADCSFSWSEKKRSSQSLCQRISVTTFESVRIASIETEADHKAGRFHQQESVASADSGVCFGYRDSIDAQHGYSAALSNKATPTENVERHVSHLINNQVKRKCSSENKETIQIRDTEEKTNETFSKNYSIFCEKLSTIQSRAIENSDFDACDRIRSYSQSIMKSTETKPSISRRPNENNMSSLKGRLKLSLQYFKNSKQLRLILLSGETAVEDNKRIYCRVIFTGNNSTHKQKTRRVRSNSGTVEFNESFYMDTESDDLNGYTLRLQLCKVSRLLRRSSKIGEALIPLEELDIDLDTTLWVKLWDSKSSQEAYVNDDFEITSENKSIHAQVLGLLQQSEDLYSRSTALTRCRSLPYMSRYGMNTERLRPLKVCSN